MTIASLEKDIILLLMFLLSGFAIREVIKPFQKYFIPASVLGGFLALLCGQQLLGLVTLPESFGQISGTLINLVLASLIFGLSIDRSRIKGYLDFSVVMLLSYGLQLVIGTLAGMGLTKVWTGLPESWGTMAVLGFWGGHGNSAAAGAIYTELGVPENIGFGMVFATVGLLTAVGVGMVLVNWGNRKGYTKYLNKGGELLDFKPVTGGVLSKEDQTSIGDKKVPDIGINNMALQLAFLLSCLFVGYTLFDLLSGPIPFLAKIPTLGRSMIGAAIVWGFMLKTGLSKYVDKKTISTISAFSLELIIVAAIATLRIELITTYFIPIIIVSLLAIASVFFVSLYFVPRVCKIDWFEKALINFGTTTGTAATGLALVRCADPNYESSAPDSMGAASAILAPITGAMPAIIPFLAVQSGFNAVFVGIAMIVGSLAVAFLFIWRKQ